MPFKPVFISAFLTMIFAGCDDTSSTGDDAGLDAGVDSAVDATVDPLPLTASLLCDSPDEAKSRTNFRFPSVVALHFEPDIGTRLPDDLMVNWHLDTQPEASMLVFEDPATPTLVFTPDAPGSYALCYQATGEGMEYDGCCPINALDGYQGARVSPLTVDPLWLRIVGKIEVIWETNQLVQIVADRVQVTAPVEWGAVESKTSMRQSGRGPGRWALTQFTFEDLSAEPGQSVEFEMPAFAHITGESNIMLNGRVDVVAPEEVPYTSPTPDRVELWQDDDGAWQAQVVYTPEVAAAFESDGVIVLLEGRDGPIWVSAQVRQPGVFEGTASPDDGEPVDGDVLATVFVAPELDTLLRAVESPSWWSQPTTALRR